MGVICIIFFFFLGPVISTASTLPPQQLVQQRILFKEARQALNEQNMDDYGKLYKQLAGYPLRPYLDIWRVRRGIGKGPDEFIGRFLAGHSDIPESIDLRKAWIKNLAKRSEWELVKGELEAYPKIKRSLTAVSLLSDWHAAHYKKALNDFSMYWIKHNKIPKSLVALEKNWVEIGHPTKTERLKKIAYLIKRGRWKSGEKQVLLLNDRAQKNFRLWKNVQRDPVKYLPLWVKADVNSEWRTLALRDGFSRLTGRGAERAWALLLKLQENIDQKTLLFLKRNISVRAAKQHLENASDWISSVPENERNEEAWAWYVRALLIRGKQEEVLKAIESMPEKQQEESRWVYWKARALEQVGDIKESKELYDNLAKDRGYYSFLSADALGLPYRMNEKEINVSQEGITSFESKPSIMRAYEWWNLGEEEKASREWWQSLQGSGKDEWLIATYVASKWGWHNQAIRAAWKAGAKDALTQRFPLAHAEEVVQAAAENHLDTSLVWGVIRQESAFKVQAGSRVGAKGLMQLMPQTAKEVAKKHSLKLNAQDLLLPNKNIQLGSLYIADMIERFNGNMVMVLAAYNAGPHRVNSWKKQIKTNEGALWVELIPFNETRRYVQQIMAFITVYDWRQRKEGSASHLSRLSFNKVEGS